MSLRSIVITLSGPICGCEEQKLAWSMPNDARGHTTLKISCETCKTYTLFAHDTVRAQLACEEPYPGRSVEVPKMEVLRGGKLLVLEQPKETT